jgi:hypothetical protein
VSRVFRTVFVALLVGVLLGGRCLPCRDLYAKAATRSCCDKSGACNKVPAKGSKQTPCPLQQNVLAFQKASTDAPVVHVFNVADIPLAQTVFTVVLPVAPPFSSAPDHYYSPPPLYLLHERLLI